MCWWWVTYICVCVCVIFRFIQVKFCVAASQSLERKFVCQLKTHLPLICLISFIVLKCTAMFWYFLWYSPMYFHLFFVCQKGNINMTWFLSWLWLALLWLSWNEQWFFFFLPLSLNEVCPVLALEYFLSPCWLRKDPVITWLHRYGMLDQGRKKQNPKTMEMESLWEVLIMLA